MTTARTRPSSTMVEEQLTPPYTMNDYPSTTFISSNPTSPQRNNFIAPFNPATRQIHPPKSPLYVPAVLRPTEMPSRRPLTPPRSLHSSTDDISRNHSHHRTNTMTQSQPISIITTLTRSSTTSSSGPSTPSSVQPTRNHWKPDSSATHCEAPGCSMAFSFLVRRHHCRRCGGLYCGTHAGATIPLDENAQIDEGGSWHRACDSCCRDWNGYSRGLLSGKLAKFNHEQNGGKDIPGSGKKSADAAGSAPKDWSWSTF